MTTKNYVSKHNKETTISPEKIEELASNGQTTSLIKEYRAFSGSGLKESKDMIESCRKITGTNSPNAWRLPTNTSWVYDISKLKEAFQSQAVPPIEAISKEEFINMIAGAVDNMEYYQCTNMIEAVEFLLKNIKNKGGLEEVAKERQKFIDSI